MDNDTAQKHIEAAATAIFNSEYADRHTVTIGDARALARIALGFGTEEG